MIYRLGSVGLGPYRDHLSTTFFSEVYTPNTLCYFHVLFRRNSIILCCYLLVFNNILLLSVLVCLWP